MMTPPLAFAFAFTLSWLPLMVQGSYLSFVVKNVYSSFNSQADFDDVTKGFSILPYKEVLFTACSTQAEEVQNLEWNSLKEDGIYRELKELIDRGGANAETLNEKVKKTKKNFSTAMFSEKDTGLYKYVWTIDGKVYEGRTVKLQFNKTATNVVVGLKQMYDDEGEVKNELTKTIPVRYVRRGMGELNAEDRRKFFMAVEKMYNTKTDDGKAEYGDYFVDMQEIWAVHNLLAVDSSHMLLGGGEGDLRSLVEKAGLHGTMTHSYRKAVDHKDDSWLEIDGDLNKYSTETLRSEPLRLEFEEKNAGLLQAAGENGMLSTHFIGDRTTSNFASFASYFEKAVQSVDPTVSLPYFEERGELGSTNFKSSVWHETFEITSLMIERGDNEDENIEKVETNGKFTYVPIITHAEPRFEGGRKLTVSKGFSVPLITVEDALATKNTNTNADEDAKVEL